MCVANLNVSLLPCRHRWFHKVESCEPSANFANCKSRMVLNGWEIKCEFCPFCQGWAVSNTEFRLIGNDSSPAIGGIDRTPSLSLTATRREARRGSDISGRNDSITSITASAGEKNKAMNERVTAYFARAPQPEISSKPAPLREVEDEDESAIASSPSDASSDGQGSLRHSSTSSQTHKAGFFKKMGRKSKRMSFNIFK